MRLILVRHAEPRPATKLAEDGLTERGRAWGLGPRDPWLTDAVIPLASITEIEFEAHREAGRLVRIVRVSDCSHLGD